MSIKDPMQCKEHGTWDCQTHPAEPLFPPIWPEATQGELSEIYKTIDFATTRYTKDGRNEINSAHRKLLAKNIHAYLTNTATRMAVEARIDEAERWQAQWVHLPEDSDWVNFMDKRLAQLQAQLKNGDKS